MRTPTSPPFIAPIQEARKRPLWSVMIPSYNCTAYLQQALESVLIQDPGPEHMQIAVIDDCSTDGDVQAVVQSIGKNRVEYFQQASNCGSLRNFETCLNKSLGQWVHLLHGDDRVVDGFYAEIESLFRDFPNAGAAFTNTADIIMGEDRLVVKAPLTNKAEIIDDLLLKIAAKQQLVPPAIVVKREVYEQLGSFFGVHYGEDWEMWTRIAAHFPVAYSPKCFAHYRFFGSGSITQGHVRKGQNFQDVKKVIDIIQNYLPSNQRKNLRKVALRNYSLYCASLAHGLYPNQPDAAFIQANGALQMSKDIQVIYLVLKLYIKDLISSKKASIDNIG